MEIFAAVILGVVQGLTEFLPVSSSAHLILVPWLLDWKPGGIVFDVALHVGTSVAIVAYFWRDWALLIREMIRGIRARAPWGNFERKLGWYLIVGSMPAAITGFFLESTIETRLRSPLVTVCTLIGFAFVLYYADRSSRQSRTIRDMGWADSLLVGLSQAAALVPGVSRSGITISAALLRHVERRSAARFSFLLSTPIIVGAGILHVLRLLAGDAVSGAPQAPPGETGVDWSILGAGVSSAAASGFLCIRFFLGYLQAHGLTPFVFYRIALGLLVLALYLGGVLSN